MENVRSLTKSSKVRDLIDEITVAVDTDCDQNPAAHAGLLKAIQKLQTAVETPLESMLRFFFLPQQDVALGVAVDMGLLEHIVAQEEKSMNASELSEKTGGATVLIVRIMRVLTAMGICDEVAEDTYRANELALAIAEGGKAGVHHLFELALPTAAKLPEYLQRSGYKNPEDPVASPFAYTFGAPVFEWFKKNPATQAVFNAYMAARRKGRRSWFDIFPVEENIGQESPGENTDVVLLVDVGGNLGHDLIKFDEKYPHIPGRLILQDLPQVVTDLHLSQERIEPMAYDFCTPQPVKGARFYHFRNIFHDWPDHTCRMILENTISAMVKDHSKLIITEFVLPNTGAPLFPCLLDMHMMGLLAGRERTEKDWRALLDSVGLMVVKIWTVEPGMESVIVAELKD